MPLTSFESETAAARQQSRQITAQHLFDSLLPRKLLSGPLIKYLLPLRGIGAKHRISRLAAARLASEAINTRVVSKRIISHHQTMGVSRYRPMPVNSLCSTTGMLPQPGKIDLSRRE
jgi:hypothetical protein